MPRLGLTVIFLVIELVAEPLSTVSCTVYTPVALTVMDVVADVPVEVCAGHMAIEARKVADESGWTDTHQL